VYFYEIHESDDDLYSDALLAHEQEFTAEEFFELVQETRRRVQDSFEEDTLVEAIAHELERTQATPDATPSARSWWISTASGPTDAVAQGVARARHLYTLNRISSTSPSRTR
jgi:hypothetical protein